MDKGIDWVGLQFFAGGQSPDKKLGSRYQFYNSRHVDFRKDPNKITLLPGARKISGGIVDDLVLDMCQLPNGKYYAVGDSGNVYKIETNDVWSLVGNIGQASGAGIAYRGDSDCVYITGQTKVARIKTATTNPIFEQNWFEGGITTNSNAYKTGGVNSYTLRTVVHEADNQRRAFYSDISPIRKIGVLVKDNGTGDWTLTLHDDANNVLATKTLASADVKDNQINYFEFADAVDISVNTSTTSTPNSRRYHFHLTSTVADGTIATTTAGSMVDCDFQIYADALIETRNGFHPIERIINSSAIGNGRYITAYEPLQDSPTTADFQRHRIVLPPGLEVCGFARKNLMLITGAEQRSTDGKFQDGSLFFWDGVQTTYNDDYPIPEGSPESLYAEKNVAWYVAGGTLYRIRGLDEPKEVRTFRDTDSEYSNISDTTHNYPHMMTVRRGILLAGYASETTNQSLEQAVFSYGSADPKFPESFGNSYTPSHGVMYNDGTNNLRLGMVKNYVDKLFISWRVGDSYGVDIVDNSSTPFSTGTIESLKHDDDRPQFFKKALFLLATFNPLPADTSVTLKYRQDGATAWQTTTAVTSGGFALFSIEKEYLDIEFGLDISCTGDTTPEIKSLYLFFDPMKGSNPVNHG